jgi:uncharacterized membrane protein YhaH (DUF805 family)
LENIDLIKLFFSWNGRINRKPYIFTALAVVFLLNTILLFTGVNPTINLMGWVILLCPTMKRLHDRDYPGWLYFFPFFIIIGGVIFSVLLSALTGYSPSLTPIMMSFVGSVLWLGLETLFMPGTKGSNTYGPDPLDLQDFKEEENFHREEENFDGLP